MFCTVAKRAQQQTQQLKKTHAKKQSTSKLRKCLYHFENIRPEKTRNTTKLINRHNTLEKITANTERNKMFPEATIMLNTAWTSLLLQVFDSCIIPSNFVLDWFKVTASCIVILMHLPKKWPDLVCL